MDRALEELAARYRGRREKRSTGPATVYHLYHLYLSRPGMRESAARKAPSAGIDIAGVLGEVGGPLTALATERYAANRRMLQKIEAQLRALREIAKQG